MASYGVEDAEYAISQSAQTKMRSEIGKNKLDRVFRERESLNIAVVAEKNLNKSFIFEKFPFYDFKNLIIFILDEIMSD